MPKKSSKAQFGIEYLQIVVWALIIVVIIIAALFFFIPQGCPPKIEKTSGSLVIVDQLFAASDVEFTPIRNAFGIYYQNLEDKPIKVERIQIKMGDVLCGEIDNINSVIRKSSGTRYIVGWLTDERCQGATLECYKFNVNIKYSSLDSDLTHTEVGLVSGAFSSLQDYWSGGELWYTSGFYGGILDMENRAGEPINYCNPESPPPPEDFLVPADPGTVYWQSPFSCNTGGLSGQGFDNAQCNGRSVLAKGWMYNTLYLDEIFSGRTVYVSGDAQYYDATNKITKNDGICVNDNLYIYVNGELQYFGGTTGFVTDQGRGGGLNDHPGEWYEGDEIIKACTGCQDVDSSGWCIPAFEMNDAGFNFGENNDIHVMVEDYCKGGGQANAGGLSYLEFTIT
ncbi:hypothetical protein H6503_06625 [Candidatus Woesearchaeota archaeon]|nr:hypothetical protein [Candidatus Woesearchaeota archaeon]